MKKLVLIAVAFVAFTAAAAQQNVNNDPYIEVRGTAKSMIDPNKAEISITLTQADSKGRMSMQELEEQLAKALRDAGVDASKQMVLTDQSSDVQKKNKAYQFKSYTLTVTTATEAQSVFEALSANGVNNASLVKVWNDNQGEIEQQLKSQAILNAQSSAKTLTQALGQSIGKAIQITDFSYNNDFVTMENSSFARKVAGVQADEAIELPAIEFKKLRVEQSVTVRFELK